MKVKDKDLRAWVEHTPAPGVGRLATGCCSECRRRAMRPGRFAIASMVSHATCPSGATRPTLLISERKTPPKWGARALRERES